jgi:hypothetical protein
MNWARTVRRRLALVADVKTLCCVMRQVLLHFLVNEKRLATLADPTSKVRVRRHETASAFFAFCAPLFCANAC